MNGFTFWKGLHTLFIGLNKPFREELGWLVSMMTGGSRKVGIRRIRGIVEVGRSRRVIEVGGKRIVIVTRTTRGTLHFNIVILPVVGT